MFEQTAPENTAYFIKSVAGDSAILEAQAELSELNNKIKKNSKVTGDINKRLKTHQENIALQEKVKYWQNVVDILSQENSTFEEQNSTKNGKAENQNIHQQPLPAGDGQREVSETSKLGSKEASRREEGGDRGTAKTSRIPNGRKQIKNPRSLEVV